MNSMACGDPLRDFLNSAKQARLTLLRVRNCAAELETRCTKTTAQMNATPGSGGADQQQQWAALVDEHEKLRQRMNDALKQMEAVQQFVDRVQPNLYRNILSLRYVHQYSWPVVAAMLSNAGAPYSMRHIQRLHGAALQAARKLWDEEHANAE